MKKSIIFVLTLLAGITTVSAAEPETQTDSVAQEQNAPKVTVKKNADDANADGEKVYDVNGDGEINITDYITLSNAIADPAYDSITANKFADIYDDNGDLRSIYDYNNDGDINSDDLSILLEKIKTNK